jgi:hypothetical protein
MPHTVASKVTLGKPGWEYLLGIPGLILYLVVVVVCSVGFWKM